MTENIRSAYRDTVWYLRQQSLDQAATKIYVQAMGQNRVCLIISPA